MTKVIKSFGIDYEVSERLRVWNQTSPITQSFLVDMLLRGYFNMSTDGIVLSGYKPQKINGLVNDRIEEVNNYVDQATERKNKLLEERLKNIAKTYKTLNDDEKGQLLANEHFNNLPEEFGIEFTKDELLERIQPYL